MPAILRPCLHFLVLQLSRVLGGGQLFINIIAKVARTLLALHQLAYLLLKRNARISLEGMRNNAGDMRDSNNGGKRKNGSLVDSWTTSLRLSTCAHAQGSNALQGKIAPLKCVGHFTLCACSTFSCSYWRRFSVINVQIAATLILASFLLRML